MHKRKEKPIQLRLYTVLIIPIMLLVISCATVSSGTGVQTPDSSMPMFYGQGEGASAVEAMTNAKRAAVSAAAIELLENPVRIQQEQVAELFEKVNDFSDYIYADTLETLSSSSEGGYYYRLGVRINLEAVAGTLVSADILGGQVTGKTDAVYVLKDRPVQKTSAAADNGNKDSQASSAGKEETGPSKNDYTVNSNSSATTEELGVIRDYIDGLTYMVYYDEDKSSDSFLSRSAVVAANHFLDKNGYNYVDLSQIEAIKKDQQIAYEEETGKAVSMIQWIAHKLNADIYIEVKIDTSGREDNGKYYGSATVSLNCYEASTAEGRGAAVYKTNPPAFSTVSLDDALGNAVSSAVYKGMEAAVADAQSETFKAVSKGFKFGLTLINTPDSSVIRDFEKKLQHRVKKIKRVSYSAEESIFEVYLIGSIADLEDLVYDSAESVAGLDGLMLVMQRRNSIIFDTGM